MAENKQKNSGKGRNGNLIPCKPGETRNPNGRPRGSVSITHLLRRLMREACDDPKAKGRTYAELFARSLIANGMAGNGTAIKEIMNRIDGLVLPPEPKPDKEDASADKSLQNALTTAAGEVWDGVEPDEGEDAQA